MHSSRMRTTRKMTMGGGQKDLEKYILYEFCKIFDILKKKNFEKKNLNLKKFE